MEELTALSEGYLASLARLGDCRGRKDDELIVERCLQDLDLVDFGIVPDNRGDVNEERMEVPVDRPVSPYSLGRRLGALSGEASKLNLELPAHRLWRELFVIFFLQYARSPVFPCSYACAIESF